MPLFEYTDRWPDDRRALCINFPDGMNLAEYS
jgi:hypothetical protein